MFLALVTIIQTTDNKALKNVESLGSKNQKIVLGSILSVLLTFQKYSVCLWYVLHWGTGETSFVKVAAKGSYSDSF